MDTLIDERDVASVAERYDEFFSEVSRLGWRTPSAAARRGDNMWRHESRHDNYVAALRKMEAFRKQMRREIAPEEWSTVEPEWQRAQRAGESLSRRLDLQRAADDVARRQSLYWMYAQGQGAELDFLQRYKQAQQARLTPRILKQIEDVEQQIRARLSAEAEQHYERRREQWEQRYAHQYIAIVDGAVIAADYRYEDLVERLEYLADQGRVFFPYVRQVGTGLEVRTPPATPAEATPAFLSGHILRAGQDLRRPAEATAAAEDESGRTTSAAELGQLFDDLRYMLGYFPLTIIVDGWEHPAARAFWQAAQALREARDRVWLLGRGPGAAPDAVYLDLDQEADGALARTLVADLLFVAAADGPELAARLTKWNQHALAAIVAAPDRRAWPRPEGVGLPHLRFEWREG